MGRRMAKRAFGGRGGGRRENAGTFAALRPCSLHRLFGSTRCCNLVCSTQSIVGNLICCAGSRVFIIAPADQPRAMTEAAVLDVVRADLRH
jgi:hypothetical protein